MATGRTLALVAIAVCLAGVLLAQEEDLALSNWSAPPYWSPAVQQRVDGEPGGAMAAHAQGMQARAEALPSSPLPFVAIAPCRIVDTRVAVSDGFHQPNFADDESRTFLFPSSPDCPGLPATAGAYSINVQFRPISQPSYLTAYPTATTRPTASTLTAGPAAWVQNAAIVAAGTGGAIDVYCQYAGRVVIDINGYYGPQSVVTSLNALTGDVTLAEGSNIAITPSGNTLTVAMTGVAGGTLPAGTASQTLYSNGSGWLASSALTNDGTNVGVSGNLNLPTTTGSTGVIAFGGSRFLHNYAKPGSIGGNTFVGRQAGNLSMGGLNSQDGAYNTAVGNQSMVSNTTGYFNMASGAGSLAANGTGFQNTAIGTSSMGSTATGNNNAASGFQSLYSNQTGSNNTASGALSLYGNTGSNNIGLGFNAGAALSFGNYNIDIGNLGVAGEGATIRIGTTGQQFKTFMAGIRGVTTDVADAVPVLIASDGQLGTLSSSIRFKQDVQDMGGASRRLMELRPVTFHYKSQPNGPLQYGLIAEEVEQVMPELVVRDATGRVETVAYHELPAMLLNELQKQQATIEAQQARLEAQQAEIDTLKAHQAELDELRLQVRILTEEQRVSRP